MFENKDVYWLSFIVAFKHISTQSVLRVFHNQSILQEILCDSIVKKIDVPLKYQDDITFNLVSDDGNVCNFIGIGVTKKPLQRKERFYVLLTRSSKTELQRQDKQREIDYWGTMFAEQRMFFYNDDPDKTIHSEGKTNFQFNLKLCKDENHHEYWMNDNDEDVYVAVSAYWIANFRPGIACFYRNTSITLNPRLNIFSDVSFDVQNNTVAMTKYNKHVVTVRSDRLLGFKKISNEMEYLAFIRNSLFLLPGILVHAKQFVRNNPADYS